MLIILLDLFNFKAKGSQGHRKQESVFQSLSKERCYGLDTMSTKDLCVEDSNSKAAIFRGGGIGNLLGHGESGFVNVIHS